jgi:malonate-semialdehyde dehydrogenase (acetylating)/methylmalonate-semialdehyde dehydrogenase
MRNPATGETLAEVRYCSHEEVNEAVQKANEAFPAWRSTPVVERVQYLFRLKRLVEEQIEDLAKIITLENGKTLNESRGELRRMIENLEVAVGIPSLIQGSALEDVAAGIDETVVRQPLGVFCAITPFNFPAMVPWWFAPYALATGNTFLIKPSEQTPLTQERIFELIDRAGFPPGVINLIHGAKETANALLEHPEIRGISFVGSTPVAKRIYRKAAEHDKRVQCQGGAKNFLVILPDADLEATVPAVLNSAYGCAGQRCLAGSVVIAVGGVRGAFLERLVRTAQSIRVGDGLEPKTQMGPVISEAAKTRVLNYIDRGCMEGARLLLDGREHPKAQASAGYFMGPTVFEDVHPEMSIATEEIFGPVLSTLEVGSLEAALEIIGRNPYGNAASIFTQSGKAARTFKQRVPCGNVGINVGVAAPMAFFPFAGMKDSFFGDLHGQGRDAIRFFTDCKVVIERW